MSYYPIENLYRPKGQRVLLLRELYALEKVHGTSARVALRDGCVHYSPGGEDVQLFRAAFDHDALTSNFLRLGHGVVEVFGEAYGGPQLGQSGRYGDVLRFIAFDVRIGGHWLAVPAMTEVATGLGLEVVPWQRVAADLAVLDALRDAPSEVAKRRGIAKDVQREGIVLRPLIELTANDGERLIAKHKGHMDNERRTLQTALFDPAKAAILSDADAIAEEWVTEARLGHVVAKLRAAAVVLDVRACAQVVQAMLDDVLREASGEIIASPAAATAIKRRAGEMYRARLRASSSVKPAA